MRTKVDRLKALMAEIGLNEKAPTGVKVALLRHVERSLRAIPSQNGTEKGLAEQDQSKKLDPTRGQQLHFVFMDEDPENLKPKNNQKPIQKRDSRHRRSS